MLSNAYTQEYFDIMESLGGDIESRRAAYDYMKNSTAIVHHQVISTSFVPRLYDRRTREIMRTTVETTHRILCKVIEHYLEDPDYRTIFDYDPRSSWCRAAMTPCSPSRASTSSSTKRLGKSPSASSTATDPRA